MSTFGLSRRGFLQSGALLAGSIGGATLLASCGDSAGGSAQSKGGTTEAAMQLGWLVDNGLLGEAVAVSQGWFADSQIELTIKPGGPSIDGLSVVAGGRGQVGQISSSPSIMLARSQGVPVKAFAVGVQEHPYAFFSRADNPVPTPEDLVGKTIGTQATGQVLVQGLLAANDIDPGDVKVTVVGSDVTPLAQGKVDVWTGWLSNVAALRPLGDKYTSFRLWDNGIQLYANIYYTTESILKDNPEMLEGFVAAASRGWQYARDNVEDAVGMLVKQNPTLNRDDMIAQSNVLLQYEFTDATATNGWGQMDSAVWKSQIDRWTALKQFKADAPSVDDVATFDILTATADKRPKVGKA